MATKKTKSTLDVPPTALTEDRNIFKSKLAERIELGKSLFDKPINNVPELELHKNEYEKWDDYNSEYLKQAFNNPQNEYKSDYDNVNTWVGFSFGGGDNSPNVQLKNLKEKIKNKVNELETLFEKADLLKSNVEFTAVSTDLVNATKTVKINNNVFIVHGHNDTVKVSVARTLEKLGLNPIILHEQPNSGKTTIEKFEKYSDVGFAVVLLTDDDEGKAKIEVEQRKRARQNVILELGYFIGRLGRSKVVPLYSDGVELPSDLYGLVYVPIDKAETWKFSLVKELKEAGYDVDANKLL